MTFTNSPLATYTRFTEKNYGPRKSRIERITIHCVVGQCVAKNCVDWFCTNGLQNSVNYVVGKDGDIAQNVDEGYGAWTSSSKANDILAVTIETASDTFDPYKVTDKAFSGLLNLVTDICKRNGIKTLIWISDKNTALAYKVKSTECILTVHRWFANKSCPGDYLFGRMGEIASTVTKRLGGETPSPKPDVNTYPSTPFLVNVLIDDLNIRTSPGMGNNLTGKYTGKGVFTIVEVSGDWGKLKSGAGWIYLANPSYLTIMGQTTQPTSSGIVNKPTDKSDYKKVWDHISKWIENDYGVAGIMGNLYAESGIIANNLQNTYEKSLGLSDSEYTEKVDNGSYKNFVNDKAGYGIAQWTHFSRKEQLLNFAKGNHSSIGNLDMQLEFLKKEITGYDLVDKLNKAVSVFDASNIIMLQYEKPADQSSSAQIKRAEYGNNFYKQFHKEDNPSPKYRVQVGAYIDRSNAEAMLKKLKAAGFDGFIYEI